MTVLRVVGLGSGTSVDALDVAVADLRLVGARGTGRAGEAEGGDLVVELDPVHHEEVEIPAELRALVLGSLPPADLDWATVARIDRGVGRLSAEAAVAAIARADDRPADLVVSHGQTVFHHVVDGEVLSTLQLGQPAWIAEATGLPVVSDVRVADVAAGGQGAPLASTLDALLLGGRPQAAAALNLGGIGNVTVVAPGTPVSAFDTGPANALLDAAVRDATQGAEQHDTDGRRSARGRVDETLLRRLLDEPYYALDPPKTTGKELFSPEYLRRHLAAHGEGVGTDDLLATLCELTARTVADALRRHRVAEVFVSGGGVRNPTVTGRLREHLGVPLRPTSELGLPEEAKEAYLFAVLGFLTWHGLPGTVPSATGARRPALVGRLTPGHLPLRLPVPASRPPSRLVVRGAGTTPLVDGAVPGSGYSPA